jgi:tRNA(adenine34) deaminase
MTEEENKFMMEALKEAHKAFDKDEIPIGAVVVLNGKIIARAHNQVELLRDATAHAEMLAITSGCAYLQSKYLEDCTMYVTLEPCNMCLAAANLAHIRKVRFGAFDSKVDNKAFYKQIELKGGFLEEECSELLKLFFLQKRL